MLIVGSSAIKHMVVFEKVPDLAAGEKPFVTRSYQTQREEKFAENWLTITPTFQISTFGQLSELKLPR